ncbi:copper resistance CopC family protein [Lentzea sp.]|uniref:copper resistance CopC family protein n=1 Tax=Lentzea sp. TaxID=56099 RepID=UPI002ED1BC17
MRRSFSALVLALLAATAVAVPAQAHAELKSSTPASGAVLDTPPRQVELTFSDVVSLPDGDAVTVTGPDGVTWPVTQSAAVDKVITAKFDTAVMRAGAHTLAWKAKSDDGDTIEGTFTFTVNLAAVPPASSASSAAAPSSVTMSAPVTNAAPPASRDSGGVPLWVWVLAGLVALVGAILLIRRRSTT